jgi:hypothetical protein
VWCVWGYRLSVALSAGVAAVLSVQRHRHIGPRLPSAAGSLPCMHPCLHTPRPPALSIVRPCALVHAHSHFDPPPAPSAASSTKGGRQRRTPTHVPAAPGPRTGSSFCALCTTEDADSYTPCQSVWTTANKARALARTQTQTGAQRPPCSMRHTALAPPCGPASAPPPP